MADTDHGGGVCDQTGHGVWSRTKVALAGRGRVALGEYTEALRGLLDGL